MSYHTATIRCLEHPDDRTGLAYLITLCLEIEYYQQGAAFIFEKMKVDKLDTETAARLGALYYAAGHFPEAERILKKVTLAQPELVPPHLILGDIYFQTGQTKEMKYHFREVLRLAPDHPRRDFILKQLEQDFEL